MTLKRYFSFVFLSGTWAFLQGCASLLPTSTTNAAKFASFEEARMTIESLVPYQSEVANLTRLGIDPIQLPNTLILTHTDIAKRVINGNLQTRDDLDKGIQDCLKAGDACRGWEINASRIARARTGSFFMDFVNLKRTTETSGWRFNATILMVNGLVVHRTWGGQPSVQEVEVRRNPLGPLQDGGLGFMQGLR
ncbi:hypothetical protein [Limnohabitans sp. 15K]|uniref:hypothetical protein n=1 Tax=Limnohabitans sp. 15K TaxID=1100706 RepID=UPI00117B55CD|nr:hypothetical protein [Limnohabitans sp. 15K]